MATKVISSRIEPTQYQQILLDCDRKNMNVTDWIQLQIAHSINRDVLKSKLIRELNSVRRRLIFSDNNSIARDKLQDIIDDIENSL